MNKVFKTIIILLLLCFVLLLGATFAKYVLSYSFDLNVTLSIDKTPPKINIVDINNDNIDNKNNSAIEHATITYSDELSGIASAIWKYNSTAKDFSKSEAHNFTSGTKFTDEGWYEITVTDKAGNISKIVFRIDWAVARIKQKYYKRLEYAINDVPVTSSSNKEADITIYMLRNVTETNTINENKTVILDINKTTITRRFYN